jgi:hypothetical protein
LNKVSGHIIDIWHVINVFPLPSGFVSHFYHNTNIDVLSRFFKIRLHWFYCPLILTKIAKCPIIDAINEFFISGELCIISKALHEQERPVVG